MWVPVTAGEAFYGPHVSAVYCCFFKIHDYQILLPPSVHFVFVARLLPLRFMISWSAPPKIASCAAKSRSSQVAVLSFLIPLRFLSFRSFLLPSPTSILPLRAPAFRAFFPLIHDSSASTWAGFGVLNDAASPPPRELTLPILDGSYPLRRDLG